MWKRKELKYKARQVVKNNYWTAIIVCFIIALTTGEFGTSTATLWQSRDSMDPNYIINNERIIMSEKIEQQEVQPQKEQGILNNKEFQKTLSDTQINIIKTIEANLNNATKSQKYIFKIYDAVKSFNIQQTGLGITLCIAAFLALAFTIFIADPLIVGGKRYFLKARHGNNTKVGVIKKVFEKGNWINVVITMLLRNIYNALWYLTIIGGIIKTYEYRMIPYILAENPKIERKQAFKLSKEMMKGNKWRTFILDMSFFGWNFLSVLTFGILSILYVNPYNSATIAELYMTLRNKAISEKFEYYEQLNDETL